MLDWEQSLRKQRSTLSPHLLVFVKPWMPRKKSSLL
uniref:Uncharacterized protein n=1 Tax=Podoviridae sp. ctiJY10 TaxID=2826572 RepID=A0A8S5N431_9CAUD|nr:MAG TPA: hypothetical protein [Podoviridae sp. ctiJY10]